MVKKILIVSLIASISITTGISMVFAQGVVSGQSNIAGGIGAYPVDPLSIPDTDLRLGVKLPQVKKIQEALRNLGYLPQDLKTTESFGPKTRDAVRSFQSAQGIPVTGFFGPATRAALKRVFEESGIAAEKNVNIDCMRVAVEKRESALLSAYDVYAAKLKTARETRKTDLLATWSIQDAKARHEARKAAWDKYRQSVRIATGEWNQTRKTIWTQFASEAKACGASAAESQDMENVEVTE